ncbi:acetyltransferase [Cyclobacterium sediminis]
MYIFGASGQGRVIIDMIDSGETIHGIFDDNPHIKEVLKYPVSTLDIYNFDFDHPFFIAIGDNKIRQSIAHKLKNYVKFETIIHSSAIISKRCEIDEGSVVMEGVIIKVNSKVGKQVIINTGASIDHDCIISDFVHLAPQTTLCGDIFIGEGTVVGAGSTVLPGIKIGKWCKIGAGSVVNKDMSDGAIWIGSTLKSHRVGNILI